MRTKYSTDTILASGPVLGAASARGNRPLPRNVVLGDQSSSADGWASGVLARSAGSAQTSKSPGKPASDAGDDLPAETCRNLPKPPHAHRTTAAPQANRLSEVAQIHLPSDRWGSRISPSQSLSDRESGALIRAGVANAQALPAGTAAADRNYNGVAFRSVCNAAKSIDISSTYALLRGCGKLDTI